MMHIALDAKTPADATLLCIRNQHISRPTTNGAVGTKGSWSTTQTYHCFELKKEQFHRKAAAELTNALTTTTTAAAAETQKENLLQIHAKQAHLTNGHNNNSNGETVENVLATQAQHSKAAEQKEDEKKEVEEEEEEENAFEIWEVTDDEPINAADLTTEYVIELDASTARQLCESTPQVQQKTQTQETATECLAQTNTTTANNKQKRPYRRTPPSLLNLQTFSQKFVENTLPTKGRLLNLEIPLKKPNSTNSRHNNSHEDIYELSLDFDTDTGADVVTFAKSQQHNYDYLAYDPRAEEDLYTPSVYHPMGFHSLVRRVCEAIGFTDNNRKRKPEVATDEVPPRPIKYRKVDNRFPRYVNNGNDAADLIAFHQPRNSLNFAQRNILQQPAHIPINSTAMDYAKAAQSRKSLFDTPVKETKLLNATSYIDLDDFEDEIDDAPQFVRQYKLARGNNGAAAAAAAVIRNSKNTNTNDISKPKQPTYAQVLTQQTTNFGVGHVLGRGRAETPLSLKSRFAKETFGGFNVPSTSAAATGVNSRSIIMQNKQAEEHAKYAMLLEHCKGNILCNESSQLISKSRAASNSSAKSRQVTTERKFPKQRARLAETTINLTNDEYEDAHDDDDVTITNVTYERPRQTAVTVHSIVLDDDNDSNDSVLSVTQDKPTKTENTIVTKKLPFVKPVNTMSERLKTSDFAKDDWLQLFTERWTGLKLKNQERYSETRKISEQLKKERKAAELAMRERMRDFHIYDHDLIVVDDFEVIEESEFVELTAEQMQTIHYALHGNPNEVIISKFSLSITRRDLNTLVGNSWLNDEVINFYMNLLNQRSEQRKDLPKVYAMNTFFLPRLTVAGYAGVKRWTRKVNLFEHDIIPVPVHVGNVHWCMAIIHLKDKTIKYYDSMGSPNANVLSALAEYLQNESLDKRQCSLDIKSFHIESVADVPRQMNGSDCGVFSCMFAEYITRNHEITFAQEHMEYFRKKMILEIAQGELLQ